MILTTLFSMFGGGLMRLMPELVGLWNKKTDNAHELAMFDKQIALEQLKAGAKYDETELQGNIDQTIALLSAQKGALESQMQKTGIYIADLLNFLVRPLTTYYFLLLHGISKVAMFVIAYRDGISGWDAIMKIYGVDDVTILSGILSFWFVGRCFDKKK
jgi:hypothetical protein